MAINQMDLIIELFPHCNLSCDFCYQEAIDQYTEVTTTQPVQMPKKWYIDQCKKSIIDNNLKHNVIEMWGGELFYDHNDHYVNHMIEFLKFLNPDRLTVNTNLIWNIDTNPLFKYLINQDYINVYLSYDPVGRFKNKQMEQLFISNYYKLLDRYNFYKSKLVMEVVLQKEVLYQTCDMSFIDELNNTNNVDLIFILDHRGYDEQTLQRLNVLLFKLFKRFPNCRNLLNLYDERLISNNYCSCHQDCTTFLTYNTEFKYNKNAVCINHNNIGNVISKFRDIYGCDNCRYVDICKDVCPTALDKFGLLIPGVACYKKFLYDHYDDLISCK